MLLRENFNVFSHFTNRKCDHRHWLNLETIQTNIFTNNATAYDVNYNGEYARNNQIEADKFIYKTKIEKNC